MPAIVQRASFDGATERILRLGLQPLMGEVEGIITNFTLLVEERADANGAAAVRAFIDARFEAAGGWTKRSTGGIDWTKCLIVNGTQVCLGVEVQFSGRSDLAIVDVQHLREGLTSGAIDVGLIVSPSDRLGVFLTDRVARFADAVKAVDRARATDLPLTVLGLEHDGPGPALAKRRTRQGKAVARKR